MKATLWLFVSVVLLMGFVAVVSLGQEAVDTNQVTIAWDEVAPIETSDIIAYEVFRTAYPITVDRQDPTLHESLGILTPLQSTITFTVEGVYALGVRTVRAISGVNEPVYSEINWSDENGVFTPNPFYVRYYKPITEPENLRLE